MDGACKFGFFNPGEQPYRYPNVWATEETTGPTRLAIAPGSDQVKLLLRLMEALPGPLWVMYVLVVPRGETVAGRYETEEFQSREAVERFLREFTALLEGDARHDLWIGTESDSAMLVYDRHNLIYAYGPLDDFGTILSEAGLEKAASIEIPFPHAHYYHDRFDADAQRLLGYWPWSRAPLTPADES
jgi:hypothetical protein